MTNQDLIQIAVLADASLNLVQNPSGLQGDALTAAVANWQTLCTETVAGMGASPQVQYLRGSFELNNETLALMCLTVLPSVNSNYINYYSKLSAACQNNAATATQPGSFTISVSNDSPTLETLASLVTTTYDAKSALLSALESGSPLFFWQLIQLENRLPFAHSVANASAELAGYFSGAASQIPGGLLTLCTGSPLNLPADWGIQPIKDQLQMISGGFAERQLTVAIRLAQNFYSQPLYRLNPEIVNAATAPREALRKALLYAFFQNGIIYWQNGLQYLNANPGFVPIVNAWLVPKKAILMMGETAVANIPEAMDPMKAGTISLMPLTRPMEKAVWQGMGDALLGKNNINWEAVSNTYNLDMQRITQTLMQLKNDTANGTPPNTAALQEAYIATSPAQLAGVAWLFTPQSDFSQMVLQNPVQQQLLQLQNTYLSRDFTGKNSESNTVAIFHGSTGTGKTMAAESLAACLKLPLYRVDCKLIDKYPQNSLERLFAEAAANSALLLFDEADALFARKNHPWEPGSLTTAFLIQQIESCGCLAILTTNTAYAIDPAFYRRACGIIYFPPFTPQQRYQLMQKLLKEKGVTIAAGINLEAFAALLPLNGRQVNQIINAAIRYSKKGDAALSDIIISAESLQTATKQEIQ
jgi:hypothetical protein